MTRYTPKRKERRTCYDRFRKRWLETRRARTNNPAASAALQLLGVFGFILGRVPITTPTPARYVAPAMSQKQAQRIEAARHLGIPTRYLEIVLSKGRVPYALLSEHIRLGGATRRDALKELRRRIPAEALDWLSYVEKRALWSELTLCFRQEDSEEDTNVRFLQAALAWVERQRKPADNLLVLAETDQRFRPSKVGEDTDDHPETPRL